MTVKCERGRRRYIVFEMTGDVDRHAIVRVIPDLPQLRVIYCGEGMAVVRCAPEGRDEVIPAVELHFPGSRSLRTSGTLKSLRDRYGPLGKRPKPSRNKTREGMK